MGSSSGADALAHGAWAESLRHGEPHPALNELQDVLVGACSQLADKRLWQRHAVRREPTADDEQEGQWRAPPCQLERDVVRD